MLPIRGWARRQDEQVITPLHHLQVGEVALSDGECEVWLGTLPSLCPFCALYLTLPHHLSHCILIMSLSDYFPQQNKRSTRINMISWESATPMLQTAELISGSFPVIPALPGLLKASTPSPFNTCVSLSGPAFNPFLFKIPIAAFTPLNCYKALT